MAERNLPQFNLSPLSCFHNRPNTITNNINTHLVQNFNSKASRKLHFSSLRDSLLQNLSQSNISNNNTETIIDKNVILNNDEIKKENSSICEYANRMNDDDTKNLKKRSEPSFQSEKNRFKKIQKTHKYREFKKNPKPNPYWEKRRIKKKDSMMCKNLSKYALEMTDEQLEKIYEIQTLFSPSDNEQTNDHKTNSLPLEEGIDSELQNYETTNGDFFDLASIDLPSVLSDNFHFSSFLPGQEETILRTLEGLSTLFISPTGSGKSLCYLLPALLLPGLSLIISPLISLMQDQLKKLPKSLHGAMIFSDQNSKEICDIRFKIRNSQIKILFISPERLQCHGFISFLLSLPSPGISFACVDEAHCVSEWSHNFRPSFLKLRRLLIDVLNVRCILALTATATNWTTSKICSSLGIPQETDKDAIIRFPTTRYSLQLSISQIRSIDDRPQLLLDLLKSPIFSSLKSIIIYVTRQDEADTISNFLLFANFSAASYHAGKSSAKRSSIQTNFMKGNLRIVVATIAFGMGIDKQDIRSVIHYNAPDCLEHYIQQIGRAGRDGKPAFCHTFLVEDDLKRLQILTECNQLDSRDIDNIFSLIDKTQDLTIFYLQKHSGGNDSIVPTFPCYVALPIEKAVQRLNIRQEYLETIFALSEQYAQSKFFFYEPSLNDTALISFHKTSPSNLAEKSRLINLIYKNPNTRTTTRRIYTLSLSRAASLLDCTIHDIQKELFSLQAQGEISIEWKDFSFIILLKSKPSQDEIDNLKFKLLCTQKKATLLHKQRVKILVDIFQKHSIPLSDLLQNINKEVYEQSKKIHDSIESYFSIQNLLSDKEDALDSNNIDLSQFPHLESDIRAFLSQNPNINSGSTVTRFFFGVSSPQFSFGWRKTIFWNIIDITKAYPPPWFVTKIANEVLEE